MQKIAFAARYLLGIPMIIFGLNKFFGFIDMPPPPGEAAQAFLGAMFTSYLAKIVAVTELVGGALLLLPKTAFIGLLMLAPVIANIVWFHLAHDMPGNGLWIASTLFFVLAALGMQDKFKALLN